ncbi:hypothetical protein SAMN04489712_115101 [Thermomonospora echinospora]|uniref:Uncharacterized protein n=1 Tax=Thermomonospora echinospora TaxID=1992 RepID=A0A1H6DCP9_9ACTN|nr:hypothetical protein [Thermomonospora echinospora]SEG82882.1 hypothetical protein SAMN04489712_115101 [Thermomonospora echinospora]
MTTVITAGRPSTWWSPDISPDQVEALLKEAFPAVDFVHFGKASRKWWAMVHGRMIGAPDLDQLYQQISDQRSELADTAVDAQPVPAEASPPVVPAAPPPWPSTGVDGRATPRTGVPLPAVRTPAAPPTGSAGHMPLPHCPVASPRPAPPLYPPPGRLRRFLNACRRFFLGEDGEDW